MANADIKRYAKEKGVYLYEVSRSLGYRSPNYATIIFRYELDETKKREVFELIDKLEKTKKAQALQCSSERNFKK